MYYKISNGSVTLDGNTILEDINFCIKNNEHIGLVGRNGAGKTTLLKAITGEYELENGYDELKIESSNNFKIGYVRQNNIDDPNLKMIDYISSAYSDLIKLELSIDKLEKKLSINYDANTINKYDELLALYEHNGGYKYKKEIEVALKKFGFNESDKTKKLREFSGGQLTKLSLVHLILSSPDLLILDEPTNHLDMSSIEWLEEYLKNYKKAIIVVSHDRMFLDNVCNVIYDIEFGILKRYEGNYSYYVKKKEEDYIKWLKDYEFQQKEIKRLQDIADKFRYKPTKAKMAMSKLKQIERMTIIGKPTSSNTKTFSINFSPEERCYRDILKVKNLSIGYDRVLTKINLSIERGDKLGIIGNNGIGKSTFVKTIVGAIDPLGGKYAFGDRVTIGYFSQQFENLNFEHTVYDEIDESFPYMTPNEIRNLLGAFEFSKDEVFKKIKDLSGGEKVRVSLCKILNSRPNLLILDEPTNHLDLISKERIEKLLKEYKGTIIMVSHDRYLINNICNKLLVLEKCSSTLYNYGYKEYLEQKKKEDTSESGKEVKKKVKKVIDFNLNKKIKSLEREIEKLESKVQQLKNELLNEDVYMDINKSTLIKKEIEELEALADSKTKEWDKLTSDI